MSKPATCATCGIELSRQNRSGYCKRHFSAAKAQDPAWRRAQKACYKRPLQANPEPLEALRARVRARNTSPEHRAWAANRAREMDLSAIGRAAARTPEANAKRAASATATKLSWCPPHLRDQYRELIYVKRMSAVEAREIILAQEQQDLLRLKKRMGAY